MIGELARCNVSSGINDMHVEWRALIGIRARGIRNLIGEIPSNRGKFESENKFFGNVAKIMGVHVFYCC